VAHLPTLPFIFPWAADTVTPPVGAPFSFLQRPLSLFNSASQGYSRIPRLLRSPLSNCGLQSRDVILTHVSPSKFPFLPFPFLLYVVVPPAINGKLVGRRRLPLPLPLSLPLFKFKPELSPFPLTLHHIFAP
jgi:hypothetical protein